jgi:asparagine synthase (glutamine-hydrolysing)
VGNFLAIIGNREARDEARAAFARGRERFASLKHCPLAQEIDGPVVYAQSFARRNGTVSPVAIDKTTGDWLLAVGSWFHADGYGAGAETRLLNAFAQAGPVHVARALSGFFTLLFHEAATQSTFVITDLIGSRHAFIREFTWGVALASSSLALASLAAAPLDPLGCEEFLCTGIVYEDRSFFRDVRKLAPASSYKFAHGKLLEKQNYWDIRQLAPESLKGNDAIEAFGASLTQAAKQVGQTFPKIISDLTGGYDSRALVAGLLTAGMKFETTVSGAPSAPDVVIARGLAGITGQPHHPVEVNPHISFAQLQKALAVTDGEIDLVEYGRNVLPVHERTARQYDISLNGSFGEVARGYWWELLLPHTGQRAPLDARKVAAGRYVVDPSSPQLFPKPTDLVAHFAAMIERANEGLSEWPNTAQMDHAYLRMRMQRWQGRMATSTDQIRACLSPLMFRPVLETMLQTEQRLRQRSLLVREMLVRLQPKLAAYPLEHGYPAEPFSLGNAYRFAPLLTSYGQKIWDKGWRVLGVKKAALTTPAAEPARVQLWREEAVRERLRPATMRLGDWLGVENLQAFLGASQQASFAYEQQWSRLLSLELALRAASGSSE